MLGASVTFADGDVRDGALRIIPWQFVAIAASIGLLALYWCAPSLRYKFYVLDPVCGLAVLGAIVHSAQAMRAPNPRTPPLAAVCESKIALTIGTFPYSLYLIHMTVLEVFTAAFGKHLPAPDILGLLRIFIAGPIILVLSYVFYRLVEKPFMTSRRTFRFVGVHRDDLPAAVIEPNRALP